RAVDRYRLDADARIAPDGAPTQPLDGRDELVCLGFAFGELDAGVQVLRVLANDDQIDVVVATANPRIPLAGPHQRVEVEGLAQCDVDASDALADRRGQRAFDCHLVAPDRLEDVRGHGIPELLHDPEPGVAHLPLDVDAGGIDDATRRGADLRADSITGNQRDRVTRHRAPASVSNV